MVRPEHVSSSSLFLNDESSPAPIGVTEAATTPNSAGVSARTTRMVTDDDDDGRILPVQPKTWQRDNVLNPPHIFELTRSSNPWIGVGQASASASHNTAVGERYLVRRSRHCPSHAPLGGASGSQSPSEVSLPIGWDRRGCWHLQAVGVERGQRVDQPGLNETWGCRDGCCRWDGKSEGG